MTERLTQEQPDVLRAKHDISLYLLQTADNVWVMGEKNEGTMLGLKLNAALEALLLDVAYGCSEEFELLSSKDEMITAEMAIEARQRWTDRTIALLQERQASYAEHARETGVY